VRLSRLPQVWIVSTLTNDGWYEYVLPLPPWRLWDDDILMTSTRSWSGELPECPEHQIAVSAVGTGMEGGITSGIEIHFFEPGVSFHGHENVA